VSLAPYKCALHNKGADATFVFSNATSVADAKSRIKSCDDRIKSLFPGYQAEVFVPNKNLWNQYTLQAVQELGYPIISAAVATYSNLPYSTTTNPMQLSQQATTAYPTDLYPSGVLWHPLSIQQTVNACLQADARGEVCVIEIHPHEFAQGAYNFTTLENLVTALGSAGFNESVNFHTVLKEVKGLTDSPTLAPTFTPIPTLTPSLIPTQSPTQTPTVTPSVSPSATPNPTLNPTFTPTITPTFAPTVVPTSTPTITNTNSPTLSPTDGPKTDTLNSNSRSNAQFNLPVWAIPLVVVGGLLVLGAFVFIGRTFCFTSLAAGGAAVPLATKDKENDLESGGSFEMTQVADEKYLPVRKSARLDEKGSNPSTDNQDFESNTITENGSDNNEDASSSRPSSRHSLGSTHSRKSQDNNI
jgi:hypothetical protein